MADYKQAATTNSKRQREPPVDFEATWELRYQGAESKLWFGTFDGLECVAKQRFSKKYRHPSIDNKLTKERTRREVRAIERIIDNCEPLNRLMPAIVWHNDSVIIMKQLTNYRPVSDYLNENLSLKRKNVDGDEAISSNRHDQVIDNFVQLLGKCLAQLHNLGLIHGDLTTSNLLIPNTDQPDHMVPIDFGLSSFSSTAEDRAVDLYVLERALLTSHFTDSSIFDRVFSCYMSHIDPATCGPPPGPERIVTKLQTVRQRGRKLADSA